MHNEKTTLNVHAEILTTGNNSQQKSKRPHEDKSIFAKMSSKEQTFRVTSLKNKTIKTIQITCKKRRAVDCTTKGYIYLISVNTQ